MSAVRVLIAVEPALFSEPLRRQLENHPAIEIVGYASRPSEALVLAGELLAEVVLIQREATDRAPGLCSHLFGEFPEMVVVAVAPNGEQATIYRQTVSAEDAMAIKKHGLAEVVSQLASRSRAPRFHLN